MREMPCWDLSDNGWHSCMSSFSWHPVHFDPRLPGISSIGALSAEHGFHACKPVNPGIARWVLDADSPREAKRRGNDRQATLLRPGWDHGDSIQVMRAIVAAKCDQHADVREALEASGNKVLVEVTTWSDQIWGTDERGIGRNQLGRIWMAERNRRWPRSCASAWEHDTRMLVSRLRDQLVEAMEAKKVDNDKLAELLRDSRLVPGLLDDSYDHGPHVHDLYWIVAAFSVLDMRIEPVLVDRLLD